MNLEKRLAIKADAQDLPLGGSTNAIKCPWCNKASSFSVTKSMRGDILYICHRASCDEGSRGGYIRDRGDRGPATQGRVFTPRMYNGTTLRLEGARLAELVRRYDLSEKEISWAGWLHAPVRDALVIPVYSPYGQVRGCVAKHFDPATIPKSLTYKEVDDVWMGWYIRDLASPKDDKGKFDQVIVVEDAISAVKASRIYPAVAIFGTHLNSKMMEEILSQSDNVILALDKDATLKAHDYAKQFAMYGNFRAIALSKDIKDMTKEELGVWNGRI